MDIMVLIEVFSIVLTALGLGFAVGNSLRK
jgi:hypothetical protein